MAISLVAVGQKWTASIANAIITAVNAISRTSVTPTSVAGTGVSLSGSKVVIAAASTVSVNGCFTSAYDWYAIEYDVTVSANAFLNLVFRGGGVDATSAYDNQRVVTINATATPAQALNSANILLGASTGTAAGARHIGTIKAYGPYIAAATAGTVLAGSTTNPMTTTTTEKFDNFFLHRTTSTYDGFTIAPGSGTATGTIRISGIA